MPRISRLPVLMVAMMLAAAFASSAMAQAPEGSRRGADRGASRSSLIGLLRSEQVQKELKLTDEQLAKVREVSEALGTEMREQFAAVRAIDDREQQRAKMNELRDEFDSKAREKLRDVLSREQMMRLYQVRMQVRPVVDSLDSRFVAGRLKLTDDQKAKLAEVGKEVQAKLSELYGQMRDASEQQRSELFQKFRNIRSEGDEKALGVLTDEQKKAFEEMKGEKIELEMRRSRG
ncbi:MAG: Spy/CpxP family protein refolding chaperone [Planctomycetes bacterium]|nr:Spy/CpxP family protein refolding chaperone [Planctomycetota bacterium]